jgi:BlaI family penicillinase repressor
MEWEWTLRLLTGKPTSCRYCGTRARRRWRRCRIGAKLAYTTILTVLRTLETKGYVGHQEQGRSYRYHATVEQQVARKSALRHLTSKLFKGSAELLMTHLVSDQKLTAEQLRRMRALLAEHDDKEQP